MCASLPLVSPAASELDVLLGCFAPLFTQPSFLHAKRLLIGAILTPGRRTVTACLRILGLEASRSFQNYHRVLSRAAWSPLQASRILLLLLIAAFARLGVLVLGVDETLERRWGKKIEARGIYRDPVRSSRGHFVKASGLRWVSLMLLVRVPFAERIWALPFLTALAPSERYARSQGRRHKKITDWARQMVKQVSRWVPEHTLILVCDSTYATFEFLHSLLGIATVITQARLDSALYALPPDPTPGRRGRRRIKGERLPSLRQRLADPSTVWKPVKLRTWYGRTHKVVEVTSFTALWYHKGKPAIHARFVLVRDPEGTLEPRAYLCTNPRLKPVRILGFFVRRWQMEVTFAEVRRHLGVETQRQWSRLAIARTTPVLLGLFSLVTLLAQRMHRQLPLQVRGAAWYEKPAPTFSDALAAVRRHLWAAENSSLSPADGDHSLIPHALFNRLADALAYAA